MTDLSATLGTAIGSRSGPVPQSCELHPAVREARKRWYLTPHALLRAKEMGFDRAAIVLVLEDPEVVYPSRGRWISQRADVAVCWIDDTVITVLWRTTEVYERAS